MLTDARGKQRVFVYGASGHAKVVIDAIECQGLYEIAFLVDDDVNLKGRHVFGYPSIGGKDDLIVFAKREAIKAGIVAIGGNPARRAVAVWLTKRGFEFITAVHPAAPIGRGVEIGAGSVIMPGAVVNADTSIGEHVIINTGATVDHDCRIGDFAHIAPGAHICGTVTIGANAFICAGVTVTPNRSIGQNVIVGAGSTVIYDLPDDITAIGSPAEILKKNEKA